MSAYTKEEFITVLGACVDIIEDTEEIVDFIDEKFRTYCGVDIFGQGELLDLFIKVLEDKMDDSDHWISWWVFEDGCGKKGLEAGKDMRPVDTIEDLWCLMNG